MIYSDSIGFIHLIASIIALIAGTWVITTKKGTSTHRKIGYVYSLSMIVLIITAFMIYRLFGGFGAFHIAAVISTITLICGMIPAIIKQPEDAWLERHFSFMYWSVIGLYGAFVSEIFTRIPQLRFASVVGISISIVMIAGGIGFYFKKKSWKKIAKIYS